MDKIRTGLEVILALFLKHMLLRRVQTLYIPCSVIPVEINTILANIGCSFTPFSKYYPLIQGIVLKGIWDTELSSEDTAHV